MSKSSIAPLTDDVSDYVPKPKRKPKSGNYGNVTPLRPTKTPVKKTKKRPFKKVGAVPQKSMKEVAKEYLALGYKIVVLCGPDGEGNCTHLHTRGYSCAKKNQGKVPLPEGWNDQDLTDEERLAWIDKFPNCNLGIVTGAVSGIVAVDADGSQGRAWLDNNPLPSETPTALAARGPHIVLKHPDRYVPSSNSKIAEGIDIKGDGGYIVAAPSLHESGHRYRWIDGLSPFDLDPAPMPDFLRETIQDNDGNGRSNPSFKRPISDLINGVQKGERNAACASMAGFFVEDFAGDAEKANAALLTGTRETILQ